MKITLRQIEGFLAAAELLSFSRAADRIGMTQPAFSQMIGELEKGLELKLFDRSTRHVRMTLMAGQLRERLGRGMEEIQEACRDAHAIARLEQGQLSLAVLPSLAFGLVMKALKDFRAQYPNVIVRLHEHHNAQVIDEVRNYMAEFGICARAAVTDKLTFEQLFVDELVCVMPLGHRLEGEGDLHWAQLQGEAIILVSTPSMANALVRQALQEHAQIVTPENEVVNMVTALGMVRAGFGLTFLPLVALPELNTMDLTYRSLASPRPLRTIGFYRRTDHALSPAAERFRDVLFKHIAAVEWEQGALKAPN